MILYKSKGFLLGSYASYTWRTDPKHLLFQLARYKFCAKMLAGRNNVLEVGCGDSFGTALVLQAVNKVHGIDKEPLIIKDNIKRKYYKNCSYEILDITSCPVKGNFDGAYSLDVIEHIPKHLEKQFIHNITSSLLPNAVCIIGTPNMTAKKYASKSEVNHINLQSEKTLKQLMSTCFKNVFTFSMNDEIVHTGFYPMAHYLLCMGTI